MKKSLFVVKTFHNKQVRFVKDDQEWMILILDLCNATDINRGHIRRIISSNYHMFYKSAREVKYPFPAGVQSISALNNKGFNELMEMILSSKFRTEDKKKVVREFQEWVNTIIAELIANKLKQLPGNVHMEQYIDRVISAISSTIRARLKTIPSNFINTYELNDLLYDDFKTDTHLVDGEHRWIEIHPIVRRRILIKALINKFGYEVWSGKTKKILYKGAPKFKRASELKP